MSIPPAENTRRQQLPGRDAALDLARKAPAKVAEETRGDGNGEFDQAPPALARLSGAEGQQQRQPKPNRLTLG
jgi:hypothetical protein